jgi:predicted acylesterase/phospholipase RssA
MSISYDKSVLKADCMLLNEHNHVSSDDHTNPLVPDAAPVHQETDLNIVSEARTLNPSSLSKYKLLPIPPRRLALCGGGIRCIAHIGVLKELQKQNLLKCVKELFGVSAGALFSLMYCIGYTLQEMETIALDFDFGILQSIEPEIALEFPQTFGLDSGDRLQRFVCSLLNRKGFSPSLTFSELQTLRPSIRFRCYATDIQMNSIKEFSLQKTPSLSVVLAVRASMSLPVLYTPVKDPETGRLLMDGGLYHNLPFVFLSEKEKKETLAVLFTVTSSIHQKNDIFNVFQNVYDSIVSLRNRIFVEKYKYQVLCISTDNFSGLEFEKTKDEKSSFIQFAEQKTKEFLLTRSIKPIRRYSVS